MTLTFYYLVPNAKEKAKKAIESKKIAKKVSLFCLHKPSLVSVIKISIFRKGYGLSAWKESLECFWGTGVLAI